MTKEERAAYMRKYREEHRDAINAKRREYCQRNREKISAQHKAWYEKHKNEPEYKAKARESHNRWVENNRDYYNSYIRDYRARKAVEE